jgi:hypothetical protein
VNALCVSCCFAPTLTHMQNTPLPPPPTTPNLAPALRNGMSTLESYLHAMSDLSDNGDLSTGALKVPKCEIFHLFDFNDFYGIKSL